MWVAALTALSLLTVTLFAYALMLRQVAEAANSAIEQQLQELEGFARDGVDPTTGSRFSSMATLVERYVATQAPSPGQAIIGIAGPGQTPAVADGTGSDLGRRLVADQARLQRLLESPGASGVVDTEQGELRWGRRQVQIQTDAGAQTGTILVVCFTRSEGLVVRQRVLLLALAALLGLVTVTAATWVLTGRQLHRLTTAAAQERAALQTELDEAYAAQHRFVSQVQSWLGAPRRRLARDLAALGQAGTERQRARLLRRTQAEVELMGSTLHHLEMLARVSRPGALTPRLVAVDQLTRSVFAEVSAKSPERWQLLQVAEVEAWLDPDWVTTAVRQLAVAADAEAGQRRVLALGSALCSDREGWFELWVVSPGRAVAAEQVQAALEDPDTDAAAIAQNGMGLGVAVVRAVADAHGGQAWLRTAKTATRVGLRLPFAVEPRTPESPSTGLAGPAEAPAPVVTDQPPPEAAAPEAAPPALADDPGEQGSAAAAVPVEAGAQDQAWAPTEAGEPAEQQPDGEAPPGTGPVSSPAQGGPAQPISPVSVSPVPLPASAAHQAAADRWGDPPLGPHQPDRAAAPRSAEATAEGAGRG
ncbi:MAG: hypothetical protein Q4G45_01250 [Actinomycetia bacterium]|nr:hypothetical protein [Actinomycetes bacterium]